MNCPTCGASNELRDTYCAECGHSLATSMKIVHLTTPIPKRKHSFTTMDKINLIFALFSSSIILGMVFYVYLG